jgi:hypothetical protein
VVDVMASSCRFSAWIARWWTGRGLHRSR